MVKQTEKNQAPYTEKTLPKDHPKHGEWNIVNSVNEEPKKESKKA